MKSKRISLTWQEFNLILSHLNVESHCAFEKEITRIRLKIHIALINWYKNVHSS